MDRIQRAALAGVIFFLIGFGFLILKGWLT